MTRSPADQMRGSQSLPEPLARAYAACAALARSHDENFPVASRLLPRSMRPHVAALYAFARVADDIADEGVAPAAERQGACVRGRSGCTGPPPARLRPRRTSRLSRATI